MTTVRWHWKVGRSRKDAEKLVLPGLIWYRTRTDDGSGFCIAAGWWDFTIAFVAVWT